MDAIGLRIVADSVIFTYQREIYAHILRFVTDFLENAVFAIMEATREIQVWALAGALAILIPALAYLLNREFQRKDQLADRVELLAKTMTDSLQQLSSVVSELTLAVSEIKVWSQDRFVARPEFESRMAQMKTDISVYAERFERELDKCQSRCEG